MNIYVNNIVSWNQQTHIIITCLTGCSCISSCTGTTISGVKNIALRAIRARIAGACVDTCQRQNSNTGRLLWKQHENISKMNTNRSEQYCFLKSRTYIISTCLTGCSCISSCTGTTISGVKNIARRAIHARIAGASVETYQRSNSIIGS